VLTLLPLLLFLHLLSLHRSYIMVNSSAFVISHQPHTTPCPLDERQRSRGGKRSESTGGREKRKWDGSSRKLALSERKKESLCAIFHIVVVLLL